MDGPVDAILPVWVLYGDTTLDFPGKFVVRQHWSRPLPHAPVPAPIACVYDTVQEAVADCEWQGRTWIGRYPADSPVILGVFV